MLQNIVQNPWQITNSDDEDETTDQFDTRSRLPPRSAAPSLSSIPLSLQRRSEPRIPDWSPEVAEQDGKFGRRRTNPSFEHAPSNHKPIFRGTRELKASTNSLLERNQPTKPITFRAPDTPPATPLRDDSTFDPYLIIDDDLNKFIHINMPKDYPLFIRCCIRRDKTTLQKGFFPRFYFCVERPGDGKKTLLLVARKTMKVNRQSEYLISASIETLSEKAGGHGLVAKLREHNMMGTEYILYDNGKGPHKFKTSHPDARNGLRRELAAIIYNTNILGMSGPRQISMIIPEPMTEVQPTKDEDTILDQLHHKQLDHLLKLRNRLPEYNKDKKLHLLQFSSNRSVEPSIKNFQMVIDSETNEEEIAMQFGRIDKDTFVCDYRYPLSAIQAFGIALSSFDSRFTRE